MSEYTDPLFIVDNSDGTQNGVDYLREWCQIASSFDIATGYFDVGALTALDGEWQKLDGMRILMGDEVTPRTGKALREAVRNRVADALNKDLEAIREPNPFLNGVPAVVEAIRNNQIQCKVYSKDKFHAKTYITHGKSAIVGSRALVGSSNFTKAGLSQNVELNIMLESGSEVAQLQRWYEKHWKESDDINDAILRILDRHVKDFTPFEVYTKALHALFADQAPDDREFEEHHSKMFPILDRYQKEAYWSLIEIARQHGGALLCDGVGLGKTFVALMLIERLVLHEGKRVVLFAPKGTKEGMWVPTLKRYLPHIGGVGGNADFSNLTVFSHTDLTRDGEFPERFKRITELADVVIVDEAHHFRNRGSAPKEIGEGDEKDTRSRYYRLFDLIHDSEGLKDPKSVYLLTATPINNSVIDLRNLIELFSRRKNDHFGRTLGIHNLESHFKSIARALNKVIQAEENLEDHVKELDAVLASDPIRRGLIVQRSRAYARKSQELEHGAATSFPERKAPQVAEYSLKKTYGALLLQIEGAFEKENPLFTLAAYSPLNYYKGPEKKIDAFELGRQKQIVRLIRTLFLKRFESSVYAFEGSCHQLLIKLLAFADKNCTIPRDRKKYDLWIAKHADLLNYEANRQFQLWDEEQDNDEDLIPEEILLQTEELSRDDFRVDDMLSETFTDLDQLAQFLVETRKVGAKNDDKLKKLIRLLKTKDVIGKKILIFSEFAHTARYLKRELLSAGIEGLEQIDGSSVANRQTVIKRFSPYYNESSVSQLEAEGEREIQVLISTDILSEGLNLQDASLLINYDIHWNPVRLMQRIGRVDRRLNPEVEATIAALHPDRGHDRKPVTINYWNFLPPDELEKLLLLYGKVSGKVLAISKLLGIEGGKLLHSNEILDPIQEFNAGYEGQASEREILQLEYQKLLIDFPGLLEKLELTPNGIFSGKVASTDNKTGVFLCYRLPALNVEQNHFTLESGVTKWYYFNDQDGSIWDDPSDIADFVRSEIDTSRKTSRSESDLVKIRSGVRDFIKNSYEKKLDVPVGSPKPKLLCWMEVGVEVS
jgi:superfamily II DNA or RNA helicase